MDVWCHTSLTNSWWHGLLCLRETSQGNIWEFYPTISELCVVPQSIAEVDILDVSHSLCCLGQTCLCLYRDPSGINWWSCVSSGFKLKRESGGASPQYHTHKISTHNHHSGLSYPMIQNEIDQYKSNKLGSSYLCPCQPGNNGLLDLPKWWLLNGCVTCWSAVIQSL